VARLSAGRVAASLARVSRGPAFGSALSFDALAPCERARYVRFPELGRTSTMQRMEIRGLIARDSNSHRYHLTDRGRAVLGVLFERGEIKLAE